MAADSPFLRNDDVPVDGPARELVGYGEHPPRLELPGGARVAVQLVVNYEEGSEKTFAMGDGENDILYELPFALEGQRDLAVESIALGSEAHALERAVGSPAPHVGEHEVGEGDDVQSGGLGVLGPGRW